MNIEQRPSGIFVVSDKGYTDEELTLVAEARNEKPAERPTHAPTLEWFLALTREEQEKIWSKLRHVLRWSGWLTPSPNKPVLHGGHSLVEFFEAMQEAGAEWEEYT